MKQLVCIFMQKKHQLFQLFLSILLFAPVALAEEVSLSDRVKEFEASFKQYLDAYKPNDDTNFEAVNLKNEIITLIYENYFKPADISNTFNSLHAKEYEQVLKAIDKVANTHPEAIQELASELQQEWNKYFLNDFLLSQRTAEDKFREPILKGLTLLSIASCFSHGIKTTLFKAFKRAFPNRIQSYVQVSSNIATGGALAGGFGARALHERHKLTLERSTQIKDIPAPPALFITLAGEPEDFVLEKLYSDKFHQDIIQLTAGTGAGLLTLVAVARYAKFLSAPTLIGFVLSFLVCEAAACTIDELSKVYNEKKYRDELLAAIKDFERKKEHGNKTELFKSVLALRKATYTLVAFYEQPQMQTPYKLHWVAPTEEALTLNLLNHLNLRCAIGGKCLDDEIVLKFRSRWQDNARAVDIEFKIRESLERKRAEKIREVLKSPNDILIETFRRSMPVEPRERRKIDIINEEALNSPLQALTEVELKSFKRLHDSSSKIFGSSSLLTLAELNDIKERYLWQILFDLRLGSLSTQPDEILLQMAALVYSANNRALNFYTREFEKTVMSSDNTKILLSFPLTDFVNEYANETTTQMKLVKTAMVDLRSIDLQPTGLPTAGVRPAKVIGGSK